MMQAFAQRYRWLLPLVLALFLLSGCSSTRNWIKSWFGIETGGTEMGENELIWEAMDQYQEGEYSQALEYFQRFKDHYPFSKYAILADLKVADCNYYLGNYEEAFFDYEEFENLHPLNEAAPYVVYQSGLCKYQLIETVDRDQKNAAKAVEIFKRLQAEHPDSVYSQKATEKLDHATKILAGHELYVARFYYHGGHYKSALGRFQAVIARYPDVGIHQQAMQYIALCEERIQQAEAAETARTAARADEATERATERAREAAEEAPPVAAAPEGAESVPAEE